MTNKEIVDIYLENGLITRCVDCQFSQIKDKQFKEDFRQDLVIILLEYDNERLNEIHNSNRMNSFITAILLRNLWSVTSPYYKKYRKFMDKASEEITDEIINTIGDE